MVATLNEMANKLQVYIIEEQSDAHSSSAFNLNIAKYNNIKLAMDETILYPHVVVRIGISEAFYDLRNRIRVEGGLGPDEKYVHKWLGYYSVVSELQDIYKQFRDNLLSLGDDKTSEDYSIEFDSDGKIKRIYEAMAKVAKDDKLKREERRKEIKKKVKDFLCSNKRKLM